VDSLIAQPSRPVPAISIARPSRLVDDAPDPRPPEPVWGGDIATTAVGVATGVPGATAVGVAVACGVLVVVGVGVAFSNSTSMWLIS
jgi:hypothetical protein